MSERVFDPFQNGWEAFEFGGPQEINRIEAPILMYAADVAEPDLAKAVAARYREQGLQPADLRFGVWPDASPRIVHPLDDAPAGVHLNIFGRRPLRYGEATPVEKHVMDVLTSDMEEHLREVVDPEYGVSVFRHGKVPTMHHHGVARVNWEDGLDWKTRLPRMDLSERHAIRDRVSLDIISGRRERIEKHIGAALELFA